MRGHVKLVFCNLILKLRLTARSFKDRLQNTSLTCPLMPKMVPAPLAGHRKCLSIDRLNLSIIIIIIIKHVTGGEGKICSSTTIVCIRWSRCAQRNCLPQSGPKSASKSTRTRLDSCRRCQIVVSIPPAQVRCLRNGVPAESATILDG